MNAKMLFMLGGGLGLFLYGMQMMGEGLERTAGNKLKKLLEILTNNRFLGVLVGAVVTAIIQSSSGTTVMVVGFVNAGLMTLTQAAGVIMGANIGTTVTAQLIAFKLTDIAPIAILLGVGMMFFAKKKIYKHVGEILAGFGILFLGMDIMSGALKPLRGVEAFQNFMVSFKHPLIGVFTGFAVTAIIQSSSASVGILQALAMQNLIGIEGAIYVIFGQNIGTCVTALLASIGTNVTARRAAAIHLMFNIIGTVVFLIILQFPFIPFIPFIKSLSPGDTVRQIANAHTIFNIAITILLFPVAHSLVALAKKVVPGEEKTVDEMHLHYLDERILETPSIAVVQVQKEIERMGELARNNYEQSMAAFFDQDENKIQEVLEREKTINYLNHEITSYLVKVSNLDLPAYDGKRISSFFHVVNDIERIGDHAENMVEYTSYCIENRVTFSEIAIRDLKEMNKLVLENVDDSLAALKSRDVSIAKRVEPREQEIDDKQEDLRQSHIERLNRQQCSPSAAIIFMDIIGNMERVADHASNIANSVMDE
ncbi:MAG: Na/Pi cotransporter family protein [Clostridia bacterium]|jgi:phosphate:Na+ symporter